MSERTRTSLDGQYPEVAPPMMASHANFSSSYEYYEGHRSPAPEYQPYPGSPPLSSSSPPPASDVTHSPHMSDNGWRSRAMSPSTQFSEYHSPPPEKVQSRGATQDDGKEYYEKNNVTAGAVPIPPPTQYHIPPTTETTRKKPLYKRPLCIVLFVAVLVIIAVAVACGVVFGTKKSKSTASTPVNNSTTPANNGSIVLNGDPDTSVGGYLNPAYYSTAGAWNGSGVAIAAADPGTDLTFYAFYQDHTGQISWRLMKADGTFTQMAGNINDASRKPLNGTPLSVVNHKLSATNLIYYVYYIDEDYTIVERVLHTGMGYSGSVIPFWDDGILTDMKLKTMQADTIGLQACYWSNFYGPWSPNDTTRSAGIHLWYASAETEFTQYSWTNGTNQWNLDQKWTGLDGHAGIGCQTWDSWMTEYVFFVDTNQDIAMYWRDNNKTVIPTYSHPTLQWVKMKNVTITDVQKSSSLGYTTYMLYQGSDATMRGANISWAAENTTVATTATGKTDIFTVEDLHGSPLDAVRGTHLSITALKTQSGGAELFIFFQEEGDEVAMYTRDMLSVGGQWQRGQNVTMPGI